MQSLEWGPTKNQHNKIQMANNYGFNACQQPYGDKFKM